MKVYKHCRLCGAGDLAEVTDLGDQPMSGIFPQAGEPEPPTAPLILEHCASCGFVQLKHSADVKDMYGVSYGYHSSLSSSMVAHLRTIVQTLLNIVHLEEGDSVLDIGCNDGTLLNIYSTFKPGLMRYGIDPSSAKFISKFDSEIKVEVDFFTNNSAARLFGNKKHKIISSIAMFYDLDDPVSFATSVENCLHDEGIWALELSYFPTLLSQLTYDQICHEHVGYYTLRDLKKVFDTVSMRIIDFSFNDVNGGSIFLMVAKSRSTHRTNSEGLERALDFEIRSINQSALARLNSRIQQHRSELRHFLRLLRTAEKRVYGYGASTKGNIVLNFCGIGPSEITAIGDLNAEKHGRRTPGSNIPILSHDEIESFNPEYLIVFVWHFRSEVINLKMDYLRRGGVLVFVLPRIHCVDIMNFKEYLDRDFLDLAFSF